MTRSLDFTFGDVRVRVLPDDERSVPAIVARLDNLHVPVPAPATPRLDVAVELRSQADVDMGALAGDIALHRVDWRPLRRTIYLRHGAERYVVLYDPNAQVEVEALRLVYHLAAGVAHRHGFVPLHSACLRIDGRGVLLCGAPGGGKSSLVFGLLRARPDATIVSDDIVWLREEAGRQVAHAANTYAKVPFDHPMMPFDARALAVGVDAGDGEYVCRIADLPVRSAPSTTVDALVFLRLLPDCPELVMRRLPPELALQAIDEPNTFFYRDIFHVKASEHPTWHAELLEHLRRFVADPSIELHMLHRGHAHTVEDSVRALLAGATV